MGLMRVEGDPETRPEKGNYNCESDPCVRESGDGSLRGKTLRQFLLQGPKLWCGASSVAIPTGHCQECFLIVITVRALAPGFGGARLDNNSSGIFRSGGVGDTLDNWC